MDKPPLERRQTGGLVASSLVGDECDGFSSGAIALLGGVAPALVGGTTSEILYSADGAKLGLMNGTAVSELFVALPGGSQAIYTASGLTYYQYANWLGSERLTTTPQGTIVHDGMYAPYGEIYNETGSASLRNFTGQEANLAADLYDFPAREYHAIHGRWIQPDPAGLGAVDVGNPQSWNRYGYVGGNPLGLVDPTGMDPSGTNACTAQNNYCGQSFLFNGGFSNAGVSYDQFDLLAASITTTTTTILPGQQVSGTVSYAADTGSLTESFEFPPGSNFYVSTSSTSGSSGGSGSGGYSSGALVASIFQTNLLRNLSNSQYCNSLAQKIANLEQTLRNKSFELETNPGQLPIEAPGPSRNSVWGHVGNYTKYQARSCESASGLPEILRRRATAASRPDCARDRTKQLQDTDLVATIRANIASCANCACLLTG